MNKLVGYVKNNSTSQVDKCVNLMSEFYLSSDFHIFKNNKIEFAVSKMSQYRCGNIILLNNDVVEDIGVVEGGGV